MQEQVDSGINHTSVFTMLIKFAYCSTLKNDLLITEFANSYYWKDFFAMMAKLNTISNFHDIYLEAVLQCLSTGD